jgi:hypothetical protein
MVQHRPILLIELCGDCRGVDGTVTRGTIVGPLLGKIDTVDSDVRRRSTRFLGGERSEAQKKGLVIFVGVVITAKTARTWDVEGCLCVTLVDV